MRHRIGLVLGALFSVVLLDCGASPRVASAADLRQLGTRTYPNHSPEEVTQAAVTGLKLLGYEIVTTDPRIRTAPKLAGVSTAATYTETTGSAKTFAESVAWDLDVKAAGPGASLHAEPRASVNGVPMEQVYYDWAQRNYAELFKAIEESFPTQRAAAPHAN